MNTSTDQPQAQTQETSLEDIEIELFVRALKLRHGYDFTQYAPASLKRRVLQLTHAQGADTVSALTTRLLHEQNFLPIVLEGLSVPVSEMFRDPDVFLALREQVFPCSPPIRRSTSGRPAARMGKRCIRWPSCSKRPDFTHRTQIYATDFNESALRHAQEGIYPSREAKLWSRNYLAAGGSHTLADYYSARYELIKLDQRLRRNVIFANHNLVTDEVFCEAHLVLCRNVLIYFSDPLQDRTLSLFRDSLVRGGFLCLGTRESLDFAPSAGDFKPVDAARRIYRLGPRNAVKE